MTEQVKQVSFIRQVLMNLLFAEQKFQQNMSVKEIFLGIIDPVYALSWPSPSGERMRSEAYALSFSDGSRSYITQREA